MCSFAASSLTRASMSRLESEFLSSLSGEAMLSRHRHRRIVDELLVHHSNIAFAHRLARHVVPVGLDMASCGRVEPRHHAHQRCLAGLRGAQQHGHGAWHQRQVERVQMDLRAHPLLDAFEHQFHAVSAFLEAMDR